MKLTVFKEWEDKVIGIGNSARVEISSCGIAVGYHYMEAEEQGTDTATEQVVIDRLINLVRDCINHDSQFFRNGFKIVVRQDYSKNVKDNKTVLGVRFALIPGFIDISELQYVDPFVSTNVIKLNELEE